MLNDLRYAWRSLRRQPTFTAVAVLTLVLGIGLNTAIFSIIKAVLLNPLPYDDSSSLVVVWEQNPDGNRDLVAPLTFLDWRAETHALEGLAAFRQLRYAFAGAGEPLDVPSVRATPNLFSILRANAALGRTFTADEGEPGRDHVALLSRAFWQRHFGGSPGIVGRTIQLDAQPYVVVGVMPADFDFPPGGSIDVWTPLSFDPADAHGRSRKARSLNVVGRLAGGRSDRGAVGPGATVDQSQREMTLIASRLAATYPDSNTGWGARVIPAREELVTTVRPALLMISAAVGFLLLIVCANVANLILARLSSRRTEIAIRAALGAGRLRLARQVIAESALLAGIGCALGLFVAWAGVRLVHALPEGSLPRMSDVRLDGGVLLFAVGVSAFTALMFGVGPAIHAARSGLRDTMHAFGGATRPAGQRLLSGLVVVEVALALVLLVGAGLMIRSFAALMRVSPGFEPRNLLAVQVYLPQTKYKSGVDRTRFYAEALQRIGALPGVQSAAAVSALPMYPVGIDFALPFSIEGTAPPANGEEPRADIRIATPGYFETMKMALVRGRVIDGRDRQGMPGAMVINETMARRYLGGGDPIGRVVVNPHGRAEVVGIVADVKHYGLDGPARAELFMPAWQNPLNGMAFVVRTASDPNLFVDSIRREILAIDAEQPIFDTSTMVDVVARSVFLPRVSMLLLSAFAASALLLAIVGIYGVVSYAVTQRTRELGVRMALGADSAATLRMVLGRSMALVLGGTACGLVVSVGLTRLLGRLLYGVSPLDATVFVAVSSLLAAAGFLASLIPARRATRVDPIVALRVD
ncbi:MAG TPA: ABC transporter permease [Vicinamibacterales bacterium]|nr:ABC transporter permease [Vicinamibacterales bacterium]